MAARISPPPHFVGALLPKREEKGVWGGGERAGLSSVGFGANRGGLFLEIYHGKPCLRYQETASGHHSGHSARSGDEAGSDCANIQQMVRCAVETGPNQRYKRGRRKTAQRHVEQAKRSNQENSPLLSSFEQAHQNGKTLRIHGY